MSIFDRGYICSECGHTMEVIEDGMTLYCPNCGRSIDPMDYGTQYEDEFAQPPILEESSDDPWW